VGQAADQRFRLGAYRTKPGCNAACAVLGEMQYANQHLQQYPLPGAPEEPELVGSGRVPETAGANNAAGRGWLELKVFRATCACARAKRFAGDAKKRANLEVVPLGSASPQRPLLSRARVSAGGSTRGCNTLAGPATEHEHPQVLGPTGLAMWQHVWVELRFDISTDDDDDAGAALGPSPSALLSARNKYAHLGKPAVRRPSDPKPKKGRSELQMFEVSQAKVESEKARVPSKFVCSCACMQSLQLSLMGPCRQKRSHGWRNSRANSQRIHFQKKCAHNWLESLVRKVNGFVRLAAAVCQRSALRCATELC
jgi:hypothetical protein